MLSVYRPTGMSTTVTWPNDRDSRELAWYAASHWQGNGSKLFIRIVHGSMFLTYCKGA